MKALARLPIGTVLTVISMVTLVGGAYFYAESLRQDVNKEAQSSEQIANVIGGLSEKVERNNTLAEKNDQLQRDWLEEDRLSEQADSKGHADILAELEELADEVDRLADQVHQLGIAALGPALDILDLQNENQRLLEQVKAAVAALAGAKECR